MNPPRSSHQRYRGFVQDYKHKRLDDGEEKTKEAPKTPEPGGLMRGKRRRYLRDYLRWLWPHRYAVGGVFLLALTTAGLEMIEPLFMRFIIDRVLLNVELDRAARLQTAAPRRRALRRASSSCRTCIRVLKDYRQRLLNVQVMLSLRRSLFDRLLHLPLPQAVGHEDRRHPVAADRRRRHDDRPAADGGHVADDLGRSADHRGRDPDAR